MTDQLEFSRLSQAVKGPDQGDDHISLKLDLAVFALLCVFVALSNTMMG